MRIVFALAEKKSPTGKRTARTDSALIHDRLRAARDDYKERYGEKS
jgi:hypothetical protein